MLVEFICNNCDNKITKLFRKAKDIPPFLDCGNCSVGKLERSLSSPSTTSTQVIDNGLYARAVEVASHVVEKVEKKVEND